MGGGEGGGVEAREVKGRCWLDVFVQGGGPRREALFFDTARAFQSSAAVISLLRRAGGDNVFKARGCAALGRGRRRWQIVDFVPWISGRPLVVDVVQCVVGLGIFLIVALLCDSTREKRTDVEVGGLKGGYSSVPLSENGATACLLRRKKNELL
jgi:hypothetical protein